MLTDASLEGWRYFLCEPARLLFQKVFAYIFKLHNDDLLPEEGKEAFKVKNPPKPN